MPTRRAFVAAMIPAVVVCGIFWLWLHFPLFLAAVIGAAFGLGGLLVTRSVYDDSVEELEAWRRAAPDLADADRLARSLAEVGGDRSEETPAGSDSAPVAPAGGLGGEDVALPGGTR